jgi:hypothetical protein
VPSGLAEHLDEYVGRGVDHRGVIDEVRCGVDDALQLNDLLDPVEGPEGLARRRQQV